MSLVVFGGQAYSVQRRVTLAATTVANIFAQANNTNTSTITAAELSQILAYPNLILYPYSSTGVAVEVSQLLVTVNGERHGDRHGQGQLGQRQWNRPPDRPAIVDRPLDRRRLFRDGQQLCRSRRGAVPVPADRNLFLRQHDDAARFDHHDPARRKPDHRAVNKRPARRRRPGARTDIPQRLRAPPVRLKRGELLEQIAFGSNRGPSLRAKRSNPGIVERPSFARLLRRCAPRDDEVDGPAQTA